MLLFLLLKVSERLKKKREEDEIDASFGDIVAVIRTCLCFFVIVKTERYI